MTPQALIAGSFFVLMGAGALVRPDLTVGFFGAKAETADFRNEVRAVYGGFGVFLGILLLATDRFFAAQSAGIFIACSVALFGMAAGRLVSFAIERTGRWPVFFFFVEVAGGLLLYTAANA